MRHTHESNPSTAAATTVMAPEESGPPRPDSLPPKCRRDENSTRSATATTTTTTTTTTTNTTFPTSQQRSSLLVPLILSVISLFLIPPARAEDPVHDFCRRWGHASAVIDDRLFIDGGYVNWEPIGADPKNYTNEWFLYHDLTSDSAGGLPPLKTLDKNNTIPNLIGSALWPDTINKRVYAFGGEVNLGTDPAPSGYELYAYDALEDRWDELDRPDIYLNSPSFGGSTAVPEHGLGFFYGGWLSNATVPGWSGSPLASDSLVVFDMDRGTWKNKTGPDGMGRAEGVMTYIPAGDNGFLVYFGGVKDTLGNGSVEAQPMDEIFLYDFVAEKWYTQKATGDVPDNRRRFCAGAAWAEDYSSYNIYLYGGLSMPPNGTAFDDVWILTMPTFQWMKWYPEPEAGVNGERPHHSLSCNVVGGGSQMIIIGGSFPTTEECDSSGSYGAHNLMLGQQNPEKRKWEVYNTTLDHYEVPDDIVAAVGGDAKGGATATAPEGGFDAQDLAVLMTRTASASTRTATRDVEPDGSGSSLSKGAIIGIAIGGAAALIAILVLGWFCLKRRRNRRQSQHSGPYSATDPLGGNAGSGAVWSPDPSNSPSSPRYYASPSTQPVTHYPPPGPGTHQDPAELPSGNMNQGVYQHSETSPSMGMHSPATATTLDGKDYVMVPVPVHRASHSSGHSHLQSPSSASFPAGYMPVAQQGGNGSPMVSPLRPQRPMTPQELSTEPRDPNDESRRDEIKHQTYYHPTQG